MITKNVDKKRGHVHNPSGRYIKSFVYGGLDGIITTFAVVAGVAGASLSASIVLILGFANLIADGISMAFGDYLSTKAEGEYGSAERRREEKVTQYPKVEKKSIINIFFKQGFSKNDAEKISSIVCKNKKACVDLMLAYELGIAKKKQDPFRNALITFSSFVLFGFIPLIAYVFSKAVFIFRQDTFVVASIFTVLTLFILGAVKCKVTGMNWLKSGLEMLFVGGFAAAAAYFIGYLISNLV
ncbi:VIT1/CCC1 transporter family protein [Candidatus Woesearchaeota archaeon]|nr:VIT1/CCC1 transporter family protein [Candidatus Woesearchaeota archaeon]